MDSRTDYECRYLDECILKIINRSGEIKQDAAGALTSGGDQGGKVPEMFPCSGGCNGCCW